MGVLLEGVVSAKNSVKKIKSSTCDGIALNREPRNTRNTRNGEGKVAAKQKPGRLPVLGEIQFSFAYIVHPF